MEKIHDEATLMLRGATTVPLFGGVPIEYQR
jgi:hypothetical protein